MIIYNDYIPLKGFSALNMCGIIFARNEYKPLDEITINHENIHTTQAKELLYIPFYLIYGIEYLIKLAVYRDTDKAYNNLYFEKEAYAHEKDLNYLKKRKHYAQWR